METIKYNNRTIIPIMKPMLVWDNIEDDAVEAFVYAKEDIKFTDYPWVGRFRIGGADVWKNAKPIRDAKPRTIEDGLEQGDIVVCDKDERKVLGICGDIIFLSCKNNFDEAINSNYKLSELIYFDYKLK